MYNYSIAQKSPVLKWIRSIIGEYYQTRSGRRVPVQSNDPDGSSLSFFCLHLSPAVYTIGQKLPYSAKRSMAVQHVKKALASPIHGGTPGWPLLPFGQFTFRWPSEARSLRPQARAASNRRRRLLASVEGVPTFLRKVGISEYLLCKYSGSPRPSATPLIKEGGKIVGSLTS